MLFRLVSSCLRTTPKPIVQGPQSAVVVGPEGEEIWTDQYGRVKIQFHWDRYGKRDEHSSCWVRVSSPWAGKHWGGIAIPRIGQEVIVDFFEGDPDRPIITGRVYNQGQMPPYGLPAHKTRSVMRSDTHKGYGRNELTFEDERGKENLFVHAQKDQTIKVLNNRAKRVKQDEVASIGRHRSVEVGGNQKHEVGHSLNLAVGGTGLRALALLGQLAHLAPQTAGLLKQAGAMAGAQGAGIGAMAMNLANSLLGFFSGGGLTGRSGLIESAGTTNDAGDTLRNNAAAVGEDVGGILSSLPGMMNTVVGTFKTDSVGVASVEQVGVSKVSNVGATAVESVGKYKKIAVGEEFVIEVGASKFIMRLDGIVIILGTNFNFTASGPVQINGVVVDLNKPGSEGAVSVLNHTPFPVIAFRHYNLAGQRNGVLAVRGTFQLVRDGALVIGKEQAPLVLADLYDGPDPHNSELIGQSDLVPVKPGTDITLVGVAYTSDGKPAKT